MTIQRLEIGGKSCKNVDPYMRLGGNPCFSLILRIFLGETVWGETPFWGEISDFVPRFPRFFGRKDNTGPRTAPPLCS